MMGAVFSLLECVGVAQLVEQYFLPLFVPCFDPILPKPAPQWPPAPHTLRSLYERAKDPFLLALLIVILAIGAGTLCVLLIPLWVILAPLALAVAPFAALVLLLVVRARSNARAEFEKQRAAAEKAAAEVTDWRRQPYEYFNTNTEVSLERRNDEASPNPYPASTREPVNGDMTTKAQHILSRVNAIHATPFNTYVSEATSLAVYGCGIIAAAHVGGLRALERHGLNYAKIETLAGVSSGSVVVAMLAVGYDAHGLMKLISSLPFERLIHPELGAVVRACRNFRKSLLGLMGWGESGAQHGSHETVLGKYNGPGLNSGTCLEEMIGDALEAQCGSRDITMAEVQSRFGKRLVIIVTELDTGHERHLTPEDDPELPVRIAVRMSMGVPGMMEPLRYQRKDGSWHVYVDGGMTDDFPLNAVPDDGHRLGLMIRPREWMALNMRNIDSYVSSDTLSRAPGMKQKIDSMQASVKCDGLYPVDNCILFGMTCCNVMMDANLMLQIKLAMKESGKDLSLRGMAPEILSICSGAMNPFDFLLTKQQHRDLYHSGQLCVHMHAAMHTEHAGETEEVRENSKLVMSDDARLKTIYSILHMDYPDHTDSTQASRTSAGSDPLAMTRSPSWT